MNVLVLCLMFRSNVYFFMFFFEFFHLLFLLQFTVLTSLLSTLCVIQKIGQHKVNGFCVNELFRQNVSLFKSIKKTEPTILLDFTMVSLVVFLVSLSEFHWKRLNALVIYKHKQFFFREKVEKLLFRCKVFDTCFRCCHLTQKWISVYNRF